MALAISELFLSSSNEKGKQALSQSTERKGLVFGFSSSAALGSHKQHQLSSQQGGRALAAPKTHPLGTSGTNRLLAEFACRTLLRTLGASASTLGSPPESKLRESKVIVLSTSGL